MLFFSFVFVTIRILWRLHEKESQETLQLREEGSFLDLSIVKLRLGQGLSCEVDAETAGGAGERSPIVWTDIRLQTEKLELTASSHFQSEVEFTQPLPLWSHYEIRPLKQQGS